jgi:hypothetical protein
MKAKIEKIEAQQMRMIDINNTGLTNFNQFIIDKSWQKEKILWIRNRIDLVKMVDLLKYFTNLETDADVCRWFTYPGVEWINPQTIRSNRSKLRNELYYKLDPIYFENYRDWE